MEHQVLSAALMNQEKLPSLPQPLEHIPIAGLARPNLSGRVATCLFSIRETGKIKTSEDSWSKTKQQNQAEKSNLVMQQVVIIPQAECCQAHCECRKQKRLSGPKNQEHACHYTSNHTVSTDECPNFLFFFVFFFS